MKAIVVFHGSLSDGPRHPLDFLLKEGFKHCFICVRTEAHWVMFNLIKNRVDVKVVAARNFDLADFYRNEGYSVVVTKQRVLRPSVFNILYGTIMVANCVGLVKSILCINSFSLTPYSLYKDLVK